MFNGTFPSYDELEPHQKKWVDDFFETGYGEWECDHLDRKLIHYCWEDGSVIDFTACPKCHQEFRDMLAAENN